MPRSRRVPLQVLLLDTALGGSRDLCVSLVEFGHHLTPLKCVDGKPRSMYVESFRPAPFARAPN
jgi:hypothetical protein